MVSLVAVSVHEVFLGNDLVDHYLCGAVPWPGVRVGHGSQHGTTWITWEWVFPKIMGNPPKSSICS